MASFLLFPFVVIAISIFKSTKFCFTTWAVVTDDHIFRVILG